MSIYLEFPAIAEYPLYSYPFTNDEELFFPENGELIQIKQENEILQDYLSLRTV